MSNDSLIKAMSDIILLPILSLLDIIIPKNKNYWGFSVHHIKSEQFIENARAVFEVIKSDKNIKKIIFTRTDGANFDIVAGENVCIIKLKSLQGIRLILKCKVLFVTHSIAMDYSFRWGEKYFSVLKLNMHQRLVINLWHGISMKRLYALSNPLVHQQVDRVKFRRKERKNYAGLIASSAIDSYAMATMFYPIKYKNIWVTGLPGNDFLMQDFGSLPPYLQNQITSVRQIKNGKKLITYAPTYRQTQVVDNSFYYQFSDKEITQLIEMLHRHNAILGFRMHYFRNDSNLFNLEKYIDDEVIFDLGHKSLSEIAPIIRESDVIITDYSSVFFDALYINKPVFCFAYDLEHYRKNQDGLLYNLELVFPSPVIADFNTLIKKIDEELTKPRQVKKEDYQKIQKLFFDYEDARNAERVVQNILEISKPKTQEKE
jgi:CDP-glycerol glycerophosphotransferase (TagB/SpsB family)